MYRWKSFEEYKSSVQPSTANTEYIKLTIEDSITNSAIVNLHTLFWGARETQRHIDNLTSLLKRWPKPEETDKGFLDKVLKNTQNLIEHLEELLAYNRSLAKKEFSYMLLMSIHPPKGWGSNIKPQLLKRRVENIVKSTEEFLEGFDAFFYEWENFIINELDDIPPHLSIDFFMARDLFSLGMPEAGAFFTGRGLEAILREIARMLKIQIEQKGRKHLLHEMDFCDLAEAFGRARWKRNGKPVINKKHKALLDLLRTHRNASAHPPTDSEDLDENEQDWKDIAKLSVRAANSVWKTSGKGRRKLVSTTIVRDW